MGWCSQFRLLMWKNVMSTKRNKRFTAYEFFMPAMAILFVYSMARSMDTSSRTIASVNHTLRGDWHDIDGTRDAACVFDCANVSNGFFAFTVVDSTERAYADAIVKKIASVYGANAPNDTEMPVLEQVYIDNDVFDGEFASVNYTEASTCDEITHFFGIRFFKIDVLKRTIKYELWIPAKNNFSAETSINELFHFATNPYAAFNSTTNLYCATGLLSFQHAIDWAFGELLPKVPSMKLGKTTFLATRPQKAKSNTYVLMLIAPVIFMLAVNISVMVAATQVAAECESGTKDYLMAMGMGRGVYIASHIAWCFVKSAIGTTVCGLLFTIFVKLEVSLAFVIILAMCYTMATASLGVLIGVLIKSSNVAEKVSTLIVAALSMLTVVDAVFPSREHVILAHLASLNPFAAVKYFFLAVLEATDRDEPATLATAFSDIRYVYTFGSAIAMSAIDALLLFGLAFFAEWFLYSISSPIHTGCKSGRGQHSVGTPVADGSLEPPPTATASHSTKTTSTGQTPETKPDAESRMMTSEATQSYAGDASAADRTQGIASDSSCADRTQSFASGSRSCADRTQSSNRASGGRDEPEGTPGSKIPSLTKSKSGSGRDIEEEDELARKAGADIVLRDVYKTYVGGEKAVRGISMKCYKGQVTVLLGHNGAGKTTVFNMITGLLAPSSGEVEIGGQEISANLSECRKLLGYCPQTNPLFDGLSVKEHLKFFASLKEVPEKEWQKEAKSLAKLLKMTDKMDTSAKELSGGMKRKLSVMISMIGQAKIVILDEATAGMDPGARKDMARLLHDVKRKRTILLTTHYTDEAEYMADRIVIMHQGKIFCSGTPEFLKKRYGLGYVLKFVMMPGDTLLIAAAVKNVIDKHVKNAVVTGIHALQVEIEIPRDQFEGFPSLLSELESKKTELCIRNFGLSMNSMEQVFLKVGAHKSEDAAQKRAIADAMAVVLRHGGGEDMTTGCHAAMQQLCALLKKRFFYAIHQPLVLFLQLVFPPLLFGLIMYITNKTGLEGNSEPVKMDLERYGTGIAAVVSDSSRPYIEEQAHTIIQSFPSVEVSDLADQNGSIVDWFANQTLSRPPLWFAYRYDESSMINEATFLSGPAHMAAVANNFVARLVLDAHIETGVKFVIPPSKLSQLAKKNGLILYFVTVIILAFLTSPFIIFPIVDRTSKFEHQQRLTGVSPVVFWIANFLFDLFIYSIGCASNAAVFIYSFDLTIAEIIGLLVAWLVYFMPCVFSIYTASYFFSSTSTAQIVLLVYQTFLPMIIEVVTLLSGASSIAKLILWPFVPSYAVGTAVSMIDGPLNTSFWEAGSFGGTKLLLPNESQDDVFEPAAQHRG